MDLTFSFFRDELCCGSIRRLLTFNLLKNFFQIADPTLAEMGKNLKEAMKMLEDRQR